ncbi:MAG: hypothetical protein JJ896_09815 [Rhodothermales bacterium]|nr:hypothetical protein [Rhodothermales bacterium]MBO6779936.1 hypothetical protein [Rhodothermales bacterium]
MPSPNHSPSDGAAPSVWIARQTPSGPEFNREIPLHDLLEAMRALAGRLQWMEANPGNAWPGPDPTVGAARRDRTTAQRAKRAGSRAASKPAT